MHSDIWALFRCPKCKGGSLTVSKRTESAVNNGELLCGKCNAEYPIQGGVPVLLPDHLSLKPSDREFAHLDSASQQKIRQREWHDNAHIDQEDDFKCSNYFNGGLFAFLLFYQLREVESLLLTEHYSRVANICCGHGFELEYLSLMAGKVIVIDISLRSVQKAISKGRRLGIDIEGICCDAEELPLWDNSFDLVLAHHSLHHLAHPMLGLEEMLRVGNSRIVFFEPAKGPMRTLVRASGLKPGVEESGNKVYEFSRREVRRLCHRTGAELRYFQKCLITGPTSEPELFKQWDGNGVSSTVGSAITLANKMFGWVIGTKCSVVIEKAASRMAAP